MTAVRSPSLVQIITSARVHTIPDCNLSQRLTDRPNVKSNGYTESHSVNLIDLAVSSGSVKFESKWRACLPSSPGTVYARTARRQSAHTDSTGFPNILVA